MLLVVVVVVVVLVFIYLYIYIYIDREREIDREIDIYRERDTLIYLLYTITTTTTTTLSESITMYYLVLYIILSEGVVYRSFGFNSGTVSVSNVTSKRWCIEYFFSYVQSIAYNVTTQR